MVAIVVVADGADLEEAAILTWARERLASYKVPKRLIAMSALPRNASGKILRRELRAPFWEGQVRAVN